MGISTSVLLLRDKNNEEYQKKLKVLRACIEAETEMPKDVDEYFGGDGIDNLEETPLKIEFEPRKWQGDCAEGYEIDIDKLPNGVKTIRFYDSW